MPISQPVKYRKSADVHPVPNVNRVALPATKLAAAVVAIIKALLKLALEKARVDKAVTDPAGIVVANLVAPLETIPVGITRVGTVKGTRTVAAVVVVP